MTLTSATARCLPGAEAIWDQVLQRRILPVANRLALQLVFLAAHATVLVTR